MALLALVPFTTKGPPPGAPTTATDSMFAKLTAWAAGPPVNENPPSSISGPAKKLVAVGAAGVLMMSWSPGCTPIGLPPSM